MVLVSCEPARCRCASIILFSNVSRDNKFAVGNYLSVSDLYNGGKGIGNDKDAEEQLILYGKLGISVCNEMLEKLKDITDVNKKSKFLLLASKLVNDIMIFPYDEETLQPNLVERQGSFFEYFDSIKKDLLKTTSFASGDFERFEPEAKTEMSLIDYIINESRYHAAVIHIGLIVDDKPLPIQMAARIMMNCILPEEWTDSEWIEKYINNLVDTLENDRGNFVRVATESIFSLIGKGLEEVVMNFLPTVPDNVLKTYDNEENDEQLVTGLIDATISMRSKLFMVYAQNKTKICNKKQLPSSDMEEKKNNSEQPPPP